jgi:RNA polymerase sigma factor (TIGR02999 family)
MPNLTLLLDAAAAGNRQAATDLLPLVYDELRKLAAACMAAEPSGNTLQPTALVHEAYLRLVGEPGGEQWNHRGHFFGAAAEAMRRILVENARRRRSLKRGGGRIHQNLEAGEIAAPQPTEDLLALDEALDRLAVLDPVKADLVKLRYFAGMTIEEAAEALVISPATAKRYWAYARTWLFQAMTEEAHRPSDPSI